MFRIVCTLIVIFLMLINIRMTILKNLERWISKAIIADLDTIITVDLIINFALLLFARFIISNIVNTNTIIYYGIQVEIVASWLIGIIRVSIQTTEHDLR